MRGGGKHCVAGPATTPVALTVTVSPLATTAAPGPPGVSVSIVVSNPGMGAIAAATTRAPRKLRDADALPLPRPRRAARIMAGAGLAAVARKEAIVLKINGLGGVAVMVGATM